MSPGPLNINPLLVPLFHRLLNETKWKMFTVSLYYFPKTNIYIAEKSQGTYVPFVTKENINTEVFMGSEIKVSGVRGEDQCSVGGN